MVLVEVKKIYFIEEKKITFFFFLFEYFFFFVVKIYFVFLLMIGAMYTPILIIFLGMTAHQAIPISKVKKKKKIYIEIKKNKKNLKKLKKKNEDYDKWDRDRIIHSDAQIETSKNRQAIDRL